MENTTPLSHFKCDKMGPGRRFYDVVVIKGTYELTAGRLSLAAEQEPVTMADEVWEPATASRSSLRRPGDLHLHKPGADVFVTGTARVPDGRPRGSWDVVVALRGDGGVRATHALRAVGRREWRHSSLRGWVLSEPEHVTEVPVRYELAWGGAFLASDDAGGARGWQVHPENPCGRGWVNPRALDRAAAVPAPQWESPEHPVGALGADVPSVGLGPVVRFAESRRRFAGTYDARWREEAKAAHERGEIVDYPPDFDHRFFHCAPPPLRTSAPLAGEQHIGLTGMIHGHEQFVTALPRVEVFAALFPGRRPWLEQVLSIDTVHIDIDAQRVTLLWRLVLDQERGITGVVLGWRDIK